MPLNKACVGKQYPPITTDVTAEAVQKYARAYNDDNPAFFDAGRPGGIIAPPMFGVTVTWQSVLAAIGDHEVKADLLRLVHGEQHMEFLDIIRPGDRITSTSKIVSIETKSSGETMEIELHATNQHGAPVQRTRFGVFIRTSGSRSGDAEQTVEVPARAEPLFSVSQTIDKDQTFRYAEASGDRNPIHTDEAVAKMAGLRGIIVHGLCTMAFTSKVAIDKLCAGDPARLKRLRVRFSRPVLPGQTITTKLWPEGERAGRKVFAYETFNSEGQAVIRAGLAEVSD
ncbi:MAG: MaoC/PaaZ C-terminal domain-containing protein [Candidatus Binataceae bacterium]